jgi:hypothetical protein
MWNQKKNLIIYTLGSDSKDGHSAFIHIQNGTNSGNRYEILLRAEDELLHDLWFADINKLCGFDVKEETQDLSIWDKTFHKTLYLECLSIKSDTLSRALNAQGLIWFDIYSAFYLQ